MAWNSLLLNDANFTVCGEDRGTQRADMEVTQGSLAV